MSDHQQSDHQHHQHRHQQQQQPLQTSSSIPSSAQPTTLPLKSLASPLKSTTFTFTPPSPSSFPFNTSKLMATTSSSFANFLCGVVDHEDGTSTVSTLEPITIPYPTSRRLTPSHPSTSQASPASTANNAVISLGDATATISTATAAIRTATAATTTAIHSTEQPVTTPKHPVAAVKLPPITVSTSNAAPFKFSLAPSSSASSLLEPSPPAGLAAFDESSSSSSSANTSPVSIPTKIWKPDDSVEKGKGKEKDPGSPITSSALAASVSSVSAPLKPAFMNVTSHHTSPEPSVVIELPGQHTDSEATAGSIMSFQQASASLMLDNIPATTSFQKRQLEAEPLSTEQDARMDELGQVAKRSKTQADEEEEESPVASLSSSKTVIWKHREPLPRRIEDPCTFLGDFDPNKMIRHNVAVPEGASYTPLSETQVLKTPAKTFPFELDPFQKVATTCLERKESILVSAHTSAGKTVVAEYAIAMAFREKERVIYTSPIKALSNQKYRELSEQFGDVGLMTGDNSINPEATCLVMTTEVLRSMLYRGSEVMRQVSWVIYDEVHYMRDKERGVVWEESIILLPDTVRLVFLSATLPNAYQFAEWVAYIHKQPCHVVYTEFRPTPLQHYMFAEGGTGLNVVVGADSVFRRNVFERVMGELPDSADIAKKRWTKSGQNTGLVRDLFKILNVVKMRKLYPVIVFSFSRKEVENNALFARKNAHMDFNDENEKRSVTETFNNAISTSLSQEDQQLPAVQSLLPMLKLGIGCHHSGLLPILKEIVEILFQDGLIKVLFATETFAIGLNMPARTVIFTATHKFDGVQKRCMTPTEYVQMSGRAGRRGLDESGNSILMLSSKISTDDAEGLMHGAQQPLNSAFYLSYQMILNMMRTESMSLDAVLEKTFFLFQNTVEIPNFDQDMAALEKRRDEIHVRNEEQIKDYLNLDRQHKDNSDDIRHVMVHPSFCLKFLQPGRLIKIEHAGQDFGWCVLMDFSCVESEADKKKRLKEKRHQTSDMYKVEVLTRCIVSNGRVFPPTDTHPGEAVIVPAILSAVAMLSAIRLHVPKDLRTEADMANLMAQVDAVHRKYPGGIPILDPIEDMKIEDPSFLQLAKQQCQLEVKLRSNPVTFAPDRDEIVKKYLEKNEIRSAIRTLRRQAQGAEQQRLLHELSCRRKVLHRLHYVNSGGLLELKGRAACEIGTNDDLLVTELLFDGTFGKLDPAQCAALLSCFVFDEKSDKSRTNVCPEMADTFKSLLIQAETIARVSRECGLGLEESEYLAKMRHELMGITLSWARGESFDGICRKTEIFEGSIIRSLRRLDELLKEMAKASQTIGSTNLEEKFNKASELIHRGIVFAPSLYL